MEFKNEEDRILFTTLVTPLILIYADLALYAKSKHGIDLVITETVTTDEQDLNLNRVSNAHNEDERRALDIRTKDVNPFIISDLVLYINNKEEFKKYHYLSNSGIKRLAYLHVGTAEHIHLCIHKKFSHNLALISE